MQPHLLLQSFYVFNSLTFTDATDVAKQHNLFLQIFGQSDNKRPSVSNNSRTTTGNASLAIKSCEQVKVLLLFWCGLVEFLYLPLQYGRQSQRCGSRAVLLCSKLEAALDFLIVPATAMLVFRSN